MATYLTFTQGTPTSDKKFTFSTWLKRGDIDSDNVPFYCGSGSELDLGFMFSDAGPGNIRANWDATASKWIVTNRLFRDPAAWYHIVFAVDTSLASSGDRLRLYVNGVEETSFSAEAQPTQDSTSAALASGQLITLGRNEYSDAKYFRGVMAHTHFIDGLQYAASDFGETDATSGIWVAKTGPSVTYGNNGFFLKYASGALGTDSSGNGNNLVVSGTMTNTKDTPDNNFATMNPLENYYQSATFTQGNNTIKTAEKTPSIATIGLESGKWYCEGKCIVTTSGTDWQIGITSTQVVATSNELGNFANDWSYQGADGKYRNNNAGSTYGNSYTTGDIIGIALDLTNSKLYFSKNGVWQDSGDPTSGGTGTGAISITAVASTPQSAYFIAAGCEDAAQDYTWSMNFGNGYFGTTAISSGNADDAGEGDFEYDVPAGYYAICTNNLGDQS